MVRLDAAFERVRRQVPRSSLRMSFLDAIPASLAKTINGVSSLAYALLGAPEVEGPSGSYTAVS